MSVWTSAPLKLKITNISYIGNFIQCNHFTLWIFPLIWFNLKTYNTFFQGTFFLYAGVCIIGTIFTVFFVPETRGKSIDEIQKFFEGKRQTTLTPATQNDTSLETPLRQINAWKTFVFKIIRRKEEIFLALKVYLHVRFRIHLTVLFSLALSSEK